MELLTYLRELNMLSLTVRLVLAMTLGGAVGFGRMRKHRPAGFRTYMLVCLGAALTMVLSQYQCIMMETVWIHQLDATAMNIDVARFGAQVINGIGFLGAGTILMSGQRQQVKGLTTAAGLWTSATMGLAIGAGFYEGVLVVFVLSMITIQILPRVELWMVEWARDMMVYVEFETVEHMSGVLAQVKAVEGQVRYVDIDHGSYPPYHHPSAVLMLHLPRKLKHEAVLSHISAADGLYAIEEL